MAALAIPAAPFRAYLFDCDGTIADSMPLHYRAWSAALAVRGCPFPEAQFYAWGGRPTEDIVDALNAHHGLSMSAAEIEHEKEALFVQLLPEMEAVPEVLAHIRATHGTIPFAVVSGGLRESVVETLGALGLLELFDTLVCKGDYARGKPAPDPFLLAAERLGVAPADCLVFEDAELGIRSAEAAGMQWVRVVPRGR